MIRSAIAGGAAIYGAIMVVQALQHPSAAAGAIAAAFLLAAAGLLLWSNDEHRLKTVEMALLWCCVALFLVYGLLAFGGVV
jgi:Ca2+/Na+ antiporter